VPSRQTEDIVKLIRQFPDRSARWLFEQPENMKELLGILMEELVPRLDFAAMRPYNIAAILPDFHERRGDVILEIPFEVSPEEQTVEGLPPAVWIHLLFEHQTKPDREMGLRFHLLKGEIWRKQRQRWAEQKRPRPPLHLSPVVPILLHTGEQQWTDPIGVSTLMDLPDMLKRFHRESDTLMLSLRDTPARELEDEDTPVSWILRVWQEARADEDTYLATLRAALSRLVEQLADGPERLANLAHFLLAFTVYSRQTAERDSAIEMIETAAQSSTVGKEVEDMGKTIYEALVEEGVEKGIERGTLSKAREVVIRVLRRRFQTIPEDIVERIERTDSDEVLDDLLDRSLEIATPEELFGD